MVVKDVKVQIMNTTVKSTLKLIKPMCPEVLGGGDNEAEPRKPR